ncbi:MAG: hypothetical protein ACI9V1_000446 [Spirosomataceae bacterium]
MVFSNETETTSQKEEAKAFFEEFIKENVMPTGNNYYDNVVNGLREWKKYVDSTEFLVRLASIRANFKPRRNLMAKLNEAFGGVK